MRLYSVLCIDFLKGFWEKVFSDFKETPLGGSNRLQFAEKWDSVYTLHTQIENCKLRV